MKVVLVTGATGLVGSYATEALLAKGYKVKALVRKGSLAKAQKLSFAKGIEWVIGDLHDIAALQEALQGVDIVVHCASMVSFSKSDANNLLHENVQGTALLVNTCLEQDTPPYLVHLSSISVLTGERNQETPLTGISVTLPDNLTSAYGRSKYYQELEVWRGIEEGLQATIINPGFILAARKDANWAEGSASIFKYVFDRKPFYTLGTLNYVAIEDVVKAIVLAVEFQIGGRHVIVGGTCTYQAFFELAAAEMAVPAPKWHLTNGMSRFLATVISVVGAILPLPQMASADALLSAQRKTVCSGKEAAKVLGFNYMSLQESITSIVQILKVQGLVP